ncbi:MAG: MFS transporter [Chloroflexota bacterium]
MFVAFEQRDFRYLALSTLALGTAQWAQQIGLTWLALQLTGSAVEVGIVSAFTAGPGVIAAPIGGYLADRFRRRTVLAWTTAASAVQASILAALVFSGLIQVWELYLLAIAGGVLQATTQPARQAFVYDVSTDATLPNAVAMNSAMQSIARVGGPPAIGAMIGILGTSAPFAFMAGAQLVAMVLTLRISTHTRQAKARIGASPFRQIVEGVQAVRQDRRILGLIVIWGIVSLIIFPYVPFLAVVSNDVLHTGNAGYGLLASMAGWGAILGLLYMAWYGEFVHKGWAMILNYVVYGVVLIVLAVSTNLALSLVLLVLAGFFSSISNTLNTTLIQLITDNAVRGRVMSIWQLCQGLQPLGALPMGLLIARAGPEIGIGAFMVTGTLAVIVYAFAWPSVRRL